MMPRLNLLLCASILHGVLGAQTMTFSGGDMQIQFMTTVTLNGELVWQIAPGATVANDGLVELGTSATLVEPVNGPIIGTGVETAVHVAGVNLNDTEPGGLGLLFFTSTPTAGAFTLTRGHLPQSDGGSAFSVARWYSIGDPAQVPFPVEFSFGYDDTELNGLVESELILHSGTSRSGPWLPLSSAVDAGLNIVLADATEQANYITAFQGEALGAPAFPPSAGLRVWPTITVDQLFVQGASIGPNAPFDVVDATGRIALSGTLRGDASTVLNLSTSALAPGQYLLRIKGEQAVRFVRE